MDMTLTFSGTDFSFGRQTRSDFGALVILLSAAQAVLPTARAAAKLAHDEDESSDKLGALIAIFAPRERNGPTSVAVQGPQLRGSFNPAVSNQYTPVTQMKAW